METISLLKDKRIVLGVTGGIAVYKVCTVASQLTQAGAHVDVVMTDAARQFVAPLTFEALTGRPAYTSMWETSSAGLPTHIAHVGLAHAADLLLIAPATANTLAKLTHGIADNLLSTLALAASCPVLAVPTMDAGMWSHPATQANAAVLRERGTHFAGPARGRMASGLEGEGRMIEPDEIVGHVRRVFGLDGPLAGRYVVVTAGPTREPIDPVRFITNPSSGRQGFALAQAAVDCGANVKLITGPINRRAPIGAQPVMVTTAAEMEDAVLSACEQADVLIMAAAVGDYRPAETATHKLKKTATEMTLHLTRTPDVLAAVSARRAETGLPRVVVGFAAETQDLLENARAKLTAKGLDMIVANDVSAADAGFATATNRVTIIDKAGETEHLPLMSKESVAEVVLERVIQHFEGNG
jgi:phosphopantothenoylcysteine decarboxylase/phosphopantothenate--cysteine ligase